MSSKSSKSGSDIYKMERSSTSTTDSGFWTTIDLLMEREWKNRKWDTMEDSQESPTPDLKLLMKGRSKAFKEKLKSVSGNRLNNLIAKIQSLEDNFLQEDGIIPDMQLSLWSTPRYAMTSFKGKGERYVDRDMLKKLQQTGRQEKMEAQQHRIKTREMEEKDRLKKLILNGRSNLEQCPPDMRNNPVYVFWRLVDKEIEKMNRARASAYYRKYRKSRRGTRRSSHREAVCVEEDSIVTRSDDSPETKMFALEEVKESTVVSNNISMNVPDNFTFKYEDEGIRVLRSLMTVRELYQMADKIIGAPREIPRDDTSTST